MIKMCFIKGGTETVINKGALAYVWCKAELTLGVFTADNVGTIPRVMRSYGIKAGCFSTHSAEGDDGKETGAYVVVIRKGAPKKAGETIRTQIVSTMISGLYSDDDVHISVDRIDAMRKCIEKLRATERPKAKNQRKSKSVSKKKAA